MPGLRSRVGPLPLWRGWRGLIRVLRCGRWDVVWLHARLPALLVRLALALGLLRLPPSTRVMLSYHGLPFDPGHRRLAALLSLRVERWLMRRCPPLHLVVLSPGMEARLRRALGPRALRRHRLWVLPNRSDLGDMPDPAPATAERHLVITGRTGYQKNYALAARLMDHLPPNYVLTLCGAGTEDAAFQRRLRAEVREDTRPRIRFAGQVADVRPLLARADCYLLTSRYEGVPIGAIEAFEAGLPIVLSPFEAAADLVAAHPMALCLPLRDLPRDAGRIVRLVEAYRADRAARRAAIRYAWRLRYPPGQWPDRVRALLGQVLVA